MQSEKPGLQVLGTLKINSIILNKLMKQSSVPRIAHPALKIPEVHCSISRYKFEDSLNSFKTMMNDVTDLSHGNIESGLSLSQSCGNMDAIDIAVEAFAEHHAVEGSVELDPHAEQIFLALDLQLLDLCHVGRLTVCPSIRS